MISKNKEANTAVKSESNTRYVIVNTKSKLRKESRYLHSYNMIIKTHLCSIDFRFALQNISTSLLYAIFYECNSFNECLIYQEGPDSRKK